MIGYLLYYYFPFVSWRGNIRGDKSNSRLWVESSL